MFRLVGMGVAAALALESASLAAPVSTPVAAGETYVSMGSSYAAGPGIGVRDESSGECRRSMSNYARLLARRHRLALVDVACSGATTLDILSLSQFGAPPQIEALTSHTKLVTVTIGSNDVGYVKNLVGYACRDAGGACPVTSDAEVDEAFAQLPDTLRRMVSEIRRRAPEAEVVLIDYLPVVPNAAACASLGLSQDDATRMHGVLDRVEHVIDGVAAETHTPLVKASAIGAGHDACSADPYVAGYKPAANPGWSHPVPFHPNQEGMDRIAAALDQTVFAEARR